MTTANVVNLEASIRARLLNIARARGEEFQSLLTRYGIERLLYRLANSAAKDRFILKGAALFYVWEGDLHRSTRDVDFLGFGDASPDALVDTFRDICATNVEPDGLTFLPDTIRAAPIREANDHGGIRVNIIALLGTARIPLQVDVGFGDTVTPGAELVQYPTLLDMPAPVVNAYPAETVIAEKYQAMVSLGIANTRMNDFYDIYVLSQTHMFDGATLVAAVTATFERRHTVLPETLPLALTSEFSADADKQTQWRAFLNRGKLTDAPETLRLVSDAIAAFIWPVSSAALERVVFTGTWLPEIGWR